jgi:rsbT co-antagonist protein RsbR
VIIDLTGAGSVDVESADLIGRMIRAIALLGAQGILAGLRPQLAAAMVEHGIDLGAIDTARNLRQALQRCIAARRRAAPVTPGAASAP